MSSAALIESPNVVPAPLSVPAATITLTQNILGAGLLALPYALKCAGIVGGLVLTVIIYFLSVFTMLLLVIVANYSGEFTYRLNAMHTFGVRWSVAVEIWVLCYTVGICIAYPILLGDFFRDVLTHFGVWASMSPDTVHLICMVGLTGLICYPLSCAPSLGMLKYTSTVGLLSIALVTVAVIVRYTDGTYDIPESTHFNWVEYDTFGSCFPILVGAFGAHYNVPTLFREVAPDAGAPGWSQSPAGRKAFRRMTMVIVGALTLSTLVYVTVGIVVYATFGAETASDFTTNFRADDIWLIVVRCVMTLVICASYPLTMSSARNAVFSLALQPRGWEMTSSTRILVTTLLTLFCLLIAAVAGDIGTVLSYNGAVFGTPVCYIAPAMMYVVLPYVQVGLQPPVSKMTWTCSSATAIFGMAFAVLGVVVATMNLNNS